MTKQTKHVRFRIRTAEGDTLLPKCEDLGPALSRSITMACKRDAEPGVWEVVEHEDVIYRVVRYDTPKLDVRIFTIGAR